MAATVATVRHWLSRDELFAGLFPPWLHQRAGGWYGDRHQCARAVRDLCWLTEDWEELRTVEPVRSLDMAVAAAGDVG
jgi:hypothetical protein